jgi:hypothetical protein
MPIEERRRGVAWTLEDPGPDGQIRDADVPIYRGGSAGSTAVAKCELGDASPCRVDRKKLVEKVEEGITLMVRAFERR